MRFIACVFALALWSGGLALGDGDNQNENGNNENNNHSGGVSDRWLVSQRVMTSTAMNSTAAGLLTGIGFDVQIGTSDVKANDDDKSGRKILLSLDSSTDPPSVKLTNPDDSSQVFLGIYRLDGNVLTMAISTGTGRPTDFTYSDSQFLIVLKRKYTPPENTDN